MGNNYSLDNIGNTSQFKTFDRISDEIMRARRNAYYQYEYVNGVNAIENKADIMLKDFSCDNANVTMNSR